MGTSSAPTSRERVLTALDHRSADRVPVDFLATPEIWRRLVARAGIEARPLTDDDYVDPAWAHVLDLFKVDCRVISYDQFCRPPSSVLRPGARIDWWDALGRSTPNRMWRQVLPDGTAFDIWGHAMRVVANPSGAYEEFAGWPLGDAATVDELKRYPWPEPEWWDFTPIPEVIAQVNPGRCYHLRFRIGSIFEAAWQLRGLEAFLTELAMSPEIPLYIMDRLTDVSIENLKRVLTRAGNQIDMVYLYDDVATQSSLMISSTMWRNYIRPLHARLAEAARALGVPAMYHCDGAVYPLIPELIDIGITLLNPIQVDAKGMDPARLKAEFGARLSFHGGIDIVHTLREGTPDDVGAEVARRIEVLGKAGGYIVASSHHIQSDTPLANVDALYDLAIRRGGLSDV
jgi:uroporphyrinogen decarboxylase